MSILARAQITIVVINDGPTGPTGKRMLTGMVHYQLSNASAPAKPSATSFNIATRVFSGLTANWAIDSPVYASGNANKYWYCTYTVEESASGSGTGTPIFGTVKQAIGFSGLVTFTGDQAVSDGTKTLSFGATGATKIDGGNIETGTVSADRIDVDNLVAKQVVIGKIQDVAGPLASTAKSEAISAAEAAAAALDDAIQVGGRNLFSKVNTEFEHRHLLAFASWEDADFYAIGDHDNYENYVRLKNIIDSNGYYTVSFEMRGALSTEVGMYISIAGTRSTSKFFTNNLNTYNGRQSYTVNVTNYSESNRHVEFHLHWAVFYVKNIKVEKGNKATDWTPAPEDVQAEIDAAAAAAAAALSDFEGVVTSSINGLQSQIDGVVDSWFNSYVPTTFNYPASEWTTTELKQGHVGDTFTNTQAYVDEATTPDAGKSWRWVNNSSVYSWTPIADSDAVKALLAASTAQDTADGKRRVFTTTPTTPYDKGDLWSGGASGDLKISTTTRAAGSSYRSGDWVFATKYTDDTAADAADAAAAAAQSTANAASTAATNAQTSANTANNLLSDIANDNKLTPLEKQETKKEWDAIVSEKTKNDSQATTFGVSKTAYGTAYTALSNYITPLLSSLTTTSDITGTTFRSTFKAYYDARTDLLNAIAAKARTLANDAQTTADNAATAAADAVTTAASDANTKMNAAKDALAVRLGYTNYDAMAAEAAANGKLIVGGLLNANIIDVQTLVALDAFLTRLVARNISTTPNAEGWFVRIDDDDPTVFEVRKKVNGVVSGTEYMKVGHFAGRPTLEFLSSGQKILIDNFGVTISINGITKTMIGSGGLFVNDLDSGLYTWAIAMYFDDDLGITRAELRLLPTSYNSGRPDAIWKDSKGYLKIGNTGNYTAADVGALPTNTIQYFTQAQWNALTQAQKNAVPLALVQE